MQNNKALSWAVCVFHALIVVNLILYKMYIILSSSSSFIVVVVVLGWWYVTSRRVAIPVGRAPSQRRQWGHVGLLLQEVKMAAQSLLSESVLGWSIFTFILLVSETNGCHTPIATTAASHGYFSMVEQSHGTLMWRLAPRYTANVSVGSVWTVANVSSATSYAGASFTC